jgi:hypothetical protein
VAGRLQKIAAGAIAASAIGALAGEPGSDGPRAIDLGEGDARGHWRFSADATRRDWDPTDPWSNRRLGAGATPRLEWRDALAGESRRASLALDWRRALDDGRI